MAPNQEVRLPEPARGQIVTGAKRLLASWQRSEDYGVSAESVDPTWVGSGTTDSLFFQCGKEVLAGLQVTLANEPVSLMLTDADGLVLNRFSWGVTLLVDSRYQEGSTGVDVYESQEVHPGVQS